MGQYYEEIPDNIYQWILKQKMFFVSTAPLSVSGHVNVSPKDGRYFGPIGKKQFWYMDLTGSGCETISHLNENGRIKVMFPAFVGAPRIVRLWGCGRVLEQQSPEFNEFTAKHSVQTTLTTRAIIIVDIHQVGSSCGFSVPYYDFKAHRTTLHEVFDKKIKAYENGKSDMNMPKFWAYMNARSMDGMPGMASAIETGVRKKVEPMKKMIGPFAPSAAFESGSDKLGGQLRHQFKKLKNTRVQIGTLVAVAVTAFLLGVLLVLCGSALIDSQRARLETLLKWTAT